MYADDLVIICKSLDELKIMITLCENICKQLGMCLNVKKCGVMYVNGSRELYESYGISMNGLKMPYVTNYEYLGLIFNNKLSWVENFNKTIKNDALAG